MDYEAIETQVLIIGAGAAGLRTAIELADHGVEALVVSKRTHGDAHTVMAAGGINAALRTRDEGDDWTLHAADTLREGHFICRSGAVELFARRAPERILELAEWGCPFERTDQGEIEQRYFGAHSYRRTCFVGDRTGKAVLETLVKRADEVGVSTQDQVFIAEILVDDGHAVGAIGWDMQNSQALVFSANAVVLAAGGFSGLYQRHSSRAGENTGDATGLGWSAGATIRDMEFVQFHPTGMVWPEGMEGQLVTEAVRAEGGRLYNARGERFMNDYAPDEMELAPRDVVARAIAMEIDEGRGTERDGVLLDISHRDPEHLKQRIPRMVERFLSLGIDISSEPMEVAPTAHYAMGGLKVDFATGATSVDGLFAVGEATSGLHGANRLGGNSLTETVVFGQITGAHLVQWVGARRRRPLDSDLVRARLDQKASLSRQKGQYRPEDIIAELRVLLERHAGIVRSEDRLRRGLKQLTDLRQRAEDLRVFTTPGSTVFERICNLDFMLDSAEMILRAAELRRESRGAHFRVDFPDSDSVWRGSVVCRSNPENGIMLDREPADEPSEEVREALQRELHLDYHHLE